MGDEGGGMQQGNVGGQMYPGGYQVPHGQGHQQQGGGLMDQLQEFWVRQRQEVGKVSEFKLQSLPLARIKKIMKSDEDVKMISAEAPVLFAKACEMFIQELTIRSWAQTEEAKRRTLQRSDVSGAIQKTDIFDFLIDIVPRNEPKEDEAHRPMPNVSNVNEGGNLSFYPMGNQGVPGVPYVMPQPMMHGNPGVQGVPSGSQVQNQDPSGQMFQQGMPAGYNPAMYPQQPMMGMNQQQMPYMGMQQRQQHMFMQQGQPRYGNYQQNNQDQNQQSLHQ